jgi:hypothetical protein
MVSIAGILANLIIAIVALGLMYLGDFLHLFGRAQLCSRLKSQSSCFFLLLIV